MAGSGRRTAPSLSLRDLPFLAAALLTVSVGCWGAAGVAFFASGLRAFSAGGATSSRGCTLRTRM